MTNSSIATASARRVQWIDLAKAFGIILVCYGHLRNGDGQSVWLPALDTSINFVYLFHMPLFFLLSGLTINTRRNFKDFVLAKAKSLLIPYYIFSLYFLAKPIAVLIVPSLRETFRSSHDYSLWHQCYEVVVNGNGLWFLMALFWAELVVYGILKLTQSRLFIACLGITLIVCYFVFSAAFPTILLPFQIVHSVEVVGFVCLGFAVKQYLLQCNRTMAAMGFVFFLGLLLVTGIIALNYSPFWVYSCVAAVAGSFTITFLSILISHIGILQYVGENSLVYYAVNALTLNIVKFVAFKILRIPGTELAGLTQLLVGMILTGVSMLILTCFNYVISRYLPWTLGRWRGRKRKPCNITILV